METEKKKILILYKYKSFLWSVFHFCPGEKEGMEL